MITKFNCNTNNKDHVSCRGSLNDSETIKLITDRIKKEDSDLVNGDTDFKLYTSSLGMFHMWFYI